MALFFFFFLKIFAVWTIASSTHLSGELKRLVYLFLFSFGERKKKKKVKYEIRRT